MELLQWLQKWFLSMCDGDWEHSYVVTIKTVDNPGWLVNIDLIDTPLEKKNLRHLTIILVMIVIGYSALLRMENLWVLEILRN